MCGPGLSCLQPLKLAGETSWKDTQFPGGHMYEGLQGEAGGVGHLSAPCGTRAISTS